MNLRISFERSSNQKPSKKAVREPGLAHDASCALQFPTRFADYLGKLGNSAIEQRSQKVVSPQASQTANGHRSLLGRALSWLNSSYSTPKQLRVVETVTLGDKRLVAVIQADGRRFLVGGGPSGVSLLTPLDIVQRPFQALESSAALKELAG
jgi:hypothetical protein